MADLNARIIAKASATAGEVPQAADLEVAEIAVNTADGKFFTKHTDGTVKEISGSGGGGGAVDSVNGETGAVSLGIQDMDDFELNSASAVVINRWATVTTTGSSGDYNEPGEASVFFSGERLICVDEDSDGADFGAQSDAAVAANGGSTTNITFYVSRDGGSSWSTHAANVTLDYGPAVTTFFVGVAPALDMTTDEIRITYQNPNQPPTPLADGDVLQWNDTDQKFKPAQISGGGGGAVDSVNGETGVVSLGIQDMDDFQLSMPSTGGLRYVFDSGDSTPETGEVYDSGGASACRFNVYKPNDADGNLVGSSWDNIEDGDEITIIYDPDGINYTATGIVSSSILQPTRIIFTLSNTASNPITNDNGLSIYFQSPKLGTNPLPLESGDILQWNDSNQKFEPAQLPPAPVDSVNGETGVVSLGIQDMDDFALNAPPGPQGLLRITNSSDSTPPIGGVWFNSDGGTCSFFMNRFDASGVDQQSLWDQVSDGDSITVYLDGVAYTGTVSNLRSASSSRIVFEGIGISATPFVAEINTGVDVVFSHPAFGSSLEPLADGDLLHWNDASQKFQPTRPSFGAERRSVVATTSSLADQASEDISFTGTGASGNFISVQTDRAAWVTFYADPASRTADSGRLITDSPTAGSGVLFEVITTGAETVLATPVVGFFNNEDPVSSDLIAKVSNRSGGTAAVEVTVKVLALEE